MQTPACAIEKSWSLSSVSAAVMEAITKSNWEGKGLLQLTAVGRKSGQKLKAETWR